ncbi:hypothetical protein B0H11DRAFT_1831189, partial [Mycena galericulata]
MPKAVPLRRSPRKHEEKRKKKGKREQEPSLPAIKWTADKGKLIWALIAEMERKENRLVLFGKEKNENTSGDSKIAVYKRIGGVIMPDLFAQAPNSLAKRIKGKAEDLVSTYKTLAKELQVTGGGLRNDDEGSGEDVHEFLECYISPEGPDHDTTEKARNLWEDIKKRFAYFPVLHKFLGARSNIVPPVLTTGVGPQGRKVVHLQAPTHDLAIDPTLQTPRQDRSASPDDPESPIEIPSSPLVPRTKPNASGATNKSA